MTVFEVYYNRDNVERPPIVGRTAVVFCRLNLPTIIPNEECRVLTQEVLEVTRTGFKTQLTRYIAKDYRSMN